MTIRVVARIRPVHQTELEKDIIVKVGGIDGEALTLVKVPNPKNEHEDFTFQFSSVYTEAAEQQTIFNNEGASMGWISERLGTNMLQLHPQSSISLAVSM